MYDITHTGPLAEVDSRRVLSSHSTKALDYEAKKRLVFAKWSGESLTAASPRGVDGGAARRSSETVATAAEADAVEVGKSVDSGGSAGSAACSAGRSAAADGVWAESAGEAKVG